MVEAAGGHATLRDYRIAIVPGLHGSGPDHWQTRWEMRYPSFRRVEQHNWHIPDLDAWSARVNAAVACAKSPVLIVAHSFGCLATVYGAVMGQKTIAGALLVAPADPEKFGVAQRIRSVKLPYPAIVVGSANDPWMEEVRARDWASTWGAAYMHAGSLGHINANSDLGDWEFGLDQLRCLAALAIPGGRGCGKCRG